MLLWRGVALLCLKGNTIGPFPEKYMNLFSSFIPGSYLPDISDIEDDAAYFAAEASQARLIFGVTMVVVLLCVAAIIVSNIFSRISKIRKGYEVSSAGAFVARLVILCGVTLAVGILLALDKGIPSVLIPVAVVVAIYAYYTQNTVPGRYLYAIGGNEKAARLSGVNTEKVMFFAYTNMGFLAGLAALVCAARFNSAAPTAGQNYEMDAIASCFIGGASAYGGTGTIGGAVIGAIFMGILNNGMSILGVDANWQRAVKGLVLLLAVIFDVVSKKRKNK
jgi:putative multiple sugar transport system permease protein